MRAWWCGFALGVIVAAAAGGIAGRLGRLVLLALRSCGGLGFAAWRERAGVARALADAMAFDVAAAPDRGMHGWRGGWTPAMAATAIGAKAGLRRNCCDTAVAAHALRRRAWLACAASGSVHACVRSPAGARCGARRLRGLRLRGLRADMRLAASLPLRGKVATSRSSAASKACRHATKTARVSCSTSKSADALAAESAPVRTASGFRA